MAGCLQSQADAAAAAAAAARTGVTSGAHCASAAHRSVIIIPPITVTRRRFHIRNCHVTLASPPAGFCCGGLCGAVDI